MLQAFWDTRVVATVHTPILIDVPKRVAKARRLRSSAAEWQEWSDPPGYFDDFVWPNHESYMREAVSKLPVETLVRVNGTMSKGKVYNAVCRAIARRQFAKSLQVA